MDSKYETRVFPRSRQLVIDSCEWARKKHIIHVLAEFDVTCARELLRDYKARTGEGLSFTAFMAACAARAVAQDRTCHAYRRGRRLLLFDDVDIGTLIEREIEGQKLATFHVLRSAHLKTVHVLHGEIRAAQRENVEATAQARRWKLFLLLPAWVRRIFYWRLDRNPELRKRLAGTVTLTAAGMGGRGAGWGAPLVTNTLTITLGGIERKPGMTGGRIEPREFISVTVSFDHDIVDGMPAARFVSRFRETVESAAPLREAPELSPPLEHQHVP